MDVLLLDCMFLEASRLVYKRGDHGRDRDCFPPLLVLWKTLAFANHSLALLALPLRKSGPCEADRAPPLTVRSNVLFLVCCECVVG
jgi:hypothetical protein